MSPIARHPLRLVNRNLQAVASAGAVFFALVAKLPTFQDVFAELPIIDALRLIALFGLPTMLLIFGRPSRPMADRVLARTTAMFLSATVAVDAIFFQSPVMLILVSGATAVLLQVAIMRGLEQRRTRKSQ